MKESEKDQSNPDKTGKESTEKTTTDGTKKEIDPNYPVANPNKLEDGTHKNQHDPDKNKPDVKNSKEKV